MTGLDDAGDAIALVRAVAERDLEGRSAILAAGDCEGIAVALAHVMAGVAELIDARAGDGAQPLLDGLQADLRAAMAADNGDGR